MLQNITNNPPPPAHIQPSVASRSISCYCDLSSSGQQLSSLRVYWKWEGSCADPVQPGRHLEELKDAGIVDFLIFSSCQHVLQDEHVRIEFAREQSQRTMLR